MLIITAFYPPHQSFGEVLHARVINACPLVAGAPLSLPGFFVSLRHERHSSPVMRLFTLNSAKEALRIIQELGLAATRESTPPWGSDVDSLRPGIWEKILREISNSPAWISCTWIKTPKASQRLELARPDDLTATATI